MLPLVSPLFSLATNLNFNLFVILSRSIKVLSENLGAFVESIDNTKLSVPAGDAVSISTATLPGKDTVFGVIERDPNIFFVSLIELGASFAIAKTLYLAS